MHQKNDIFSQGQEILNNSIYREDCKILFDSQNAMEYQLDEVGEKFYKFVTKNKSLETAVADICNYYNISNIEMIENDLIEFLEKFLKKNKNMINNIANGQIEKNINISEIKFPFAVELELTKACNFRCPFCYNTWKYEKNKNKEYNHLNKYAILKLLDECKNNNLLKVRYSGGEPTLYPDLDELLVYGKKLGFFQSIFTNAYMLNKERIQLWKDNNVKEVLISLHGTEKTHEKITMVSGSYNKTIDNIKQLTNCGIKVIVEMTLVSHNLNEVESVMETLYQLGIKELRIMKYVPTGSEFDSELSVSNEELESIIQKIEKCRYYKERLINIAFPCSQKFCTSQGKINEEIYSRNKQFLLNNCMAGINWISIDYNGFVKICPHSYKKFNNINDDDFSVLETWENMTKTEAQRIIEEREEKCKECMAWNSCLGGCLLN